MPTASGNAVWALKATSVQFTWMFSRNACVEWRSSGKRAGGGERGSSDSQVSIPRTNFLPLPPSFLPLSLSLEFQFQGTKVRRLCLRILSSRNALDTAPDKVLSIETCGCDHIRPLGKMVLYDTVSPCLHIPYSSETNCTFEYAMKSWLRFLSFLL